MASYKNTLDLQSDIEEIEKGISKTSISKSESPNIQHEEKESPWIQYLGTNYLKELQEIKRKEKKEKEIAAKILEQEKRELLSLQAIKDCYERKSAEQRASIKKQINRKGIDPKYMALFKRHPRTRELQFVRCTYCKYLIFIEAFKEHIERRHTVQTEEVKDEGMLLILKKKNILEPVSFITPETKAGTQTKKCGDHHTKPFVKASSPKGRGAKTKGRKNGKSLNYPKVSNENEAETNKDKTTSSRSDKSKGNNIQSDNETSDYNSAAKLLDSPSEHIQITGRKKSREKSPEKRIVELKLVDVVKSEGTKISKPDTVGKEQVTDFEINTDNLDSPTELIQRTDRKKSTEISLTKRIMELKLLDVVKSKVTDIPKLDRVEKEQVTDFDINTDNEMDDKAKAWSLHYELKSEEQRTSLQKVDYFAKRKANKSNRRSDSAPPMKNKQTDISTIERNKQNINSEKLFEEVTSNRSKKNGLSSSKKEMKKPRSLSAPPTKSKQIHDIKENIAGKEHNLPDDKESIHGGHSIQEEKESPKQIAQLERNDEISARHVTLQHTFDISPKQTQCQIWSINSVGERYFCPKKKKMQFSWNIEPPSNVKEEIYNITKKVRFQVEKRLIDKDKANVKKMDDKKKEEGHKKSKGKILVDSKIDLKNDVINPSNSNQTLAEIHFDVDDVFDSKKKQKSTGTIKQLEPKYIEGKGSVSPQIPFQQQTNQPDMLQRKISSGPGNDSVHGLIKSIKEAEDKKIKENVFKKDKITAIDNFKLHSSTKKNLISSKMNKEKKKTETIRQKDSVQTQYQVKSDTLSSESENVSIHHLPETKWKSPVKGRNKITRNETDRHKKKQEKQVKSKYIDEEDSVSPQIPSQQQTNQYDILQRKSSTEILEKFPGQRNVSGHNLLKISSQLPIRKKTNEDKDCTKKAEDKKIKDDVLKGDKINVIESQLQMNQSDQKISDTISSASENLLIHNLFKPVSKSSIEERKKIASSENDHNKKRDSGKEEELQKCVTKTVNSPSEECVSANTKSCRMNKERKSDKTLKRKRSKHIEQTDFTSVLAKIKCQQQRRQSPTDKIKLRDQASEIKTSSVKIVVDIKQNNQNVRERPAEYTSMIKEVPKNVEINAIKYINPDSSAERNKFPNADRCRLDKEKKFIETITQETPNLIQQKESAQTQRQLQINESQIIQTIHDKILESGQSTTDDIKDKVTDFKPVSVKIVLEDQQSKQRVEKMPATQMDTAEYKSMKENVPKNDDINATRYIDQHSSAERDELPNTDSCRMDKEKFMETITQETPNLIQEKKSAQTLPQLQINESEIVQTIPDKIILESEQSSTDETKDKATDFKPVSVKIVLEDQQSKQRVEKMPATQMDTAEYKSMKENVPKNDDVNANRNIDQDSSAERSELPNADSCRMDKEKFMETITQETPNLIQEKKSAQTLPQLQINESEIVQTIPDKIILESEQSSTDETKDKATDFKPVSVKIVLEDQQSKQRVEKMPTTQMDTAEYKSMKENVPKNDDINATRYIDPDSYAERGELPNADSCRMDKEKFMETITQETPNPIQEKKSALTLPQLQINESENVQTIPDKIILESEQSSTDETKDKARDFKPVSVKIILEDLQSKQRVEKMPATQMDTAEYKSMKENVPKNDVVKATRYIDQDSSAERSELPNADSCRMDKEKFMETITQETPNLIQEKKSAQALPELQINESEIVETIPDKIILESELSSTDETKDKARDFKPVSVKIVLEDQQSKQRVEKMPATQMDTAEYKSMKENVPKNDVVKATRYIDQDSSAERSELPNADSCRMDKEKFMETITQETPNSIQEKKSALTLSQLQINESKNVQTIPDKIILESEQSSTDETKDKARDFKPVSVKTILEDLQSKQRVEKMPATQMDTAEYKSMKENVPKNDINATRYIDQDSSAERSELPNADSCRMDKEKFMETITQETPNSIQEKKSALTLSQLQINESENVQTIPDKIILESEQSSTDETKDKARDFKPVSVKTILEDLQSKQRVEKMPATQMDTAEYKSMKENVPKNDINATRYIDQDSSAERSELPNADSCRMDKETFMETITQETPNLIQEKKSAQALPELQINECEIVQTISDKIILESEQSSTDETKDMATDFKPVSVKIILEDLQSKQRVEKMPATQMDTAEYKSMKENVPKNDVVKATRYIDQDSSAERSELPNADSCRMDKEKFMETITQETPNLIQEKKSAQALPELQINESEIVQTIPDKIILESEQSSTDETKDKARDFKPVSVKIVLEDQQSKQRVEKMPATQMDTAEYKSMKENVPKNDVVKATRCIDQDSSAERSELPNADSCRMDKEKFMETITQETPNSIQEKKSALTLSQLQINESENVQTIPDKNILESEQSSTDETKDKARDFKPVSVKTILEDLQSKQRVEKMPATQMDTAEYKSMKENVPKNDINATRYIDQDSSAERSELPNADSCRMDKETFMETITQETPNLIQEKKSAQALPELQINESENVQTIPDKIILESEQSSTDETKDKARDFKPVSVKIILEDLQSKQRVEKMPATQMDTAEYKSMKENVPKNDVVKATRYIDQDSSAERSELPNADSCRMDKEKFVETITQETPNLIQEKKSAQALPELQINESEIVQTIPDKIILESEQSSTDETKDKARDFKPVSVKIVLEDQQSKQRVEKMPATQMDTAEYKSMKENVPKNDVVKATRYIDQDSSAERSELPNADSCRMDKEKFMETITQETPNSIQEKKSALTLSQLQINESENVQTIPDKIILESEQSSTDETKDKARDFKPVSVKTILEDLQSKQRVEKIPATQMDTAEYKSMKENVPKNDINATRYIDQDSSAERSELPNADSCRMDKETFMETITQETPNLIQEKKSAQALPELQINECEIVQTISDKIILESEQSSTDETKDKATDFKPVSVKIILEDLQSKQRVEKMPATQMEHNGCQQHNGYKSMKENVPKNNDINATRYVGQDSSADRGELPNADSCRMDKEKFMETITQETPNLIQEKKSALTLPQLQINESEIVQTIPDKIILESEQSSSDETKDKATDFKPVSVKIVLEDQQSKQRVEKMPPTQMDTAEYKSMKENVPKNDVVKATRCIDQDSSAERSELPNADSCRMEKEIFMETITQETPNIIQKKESAQTLPQLQINESEIVQTIPNKIILEDENVPIHNSPKPVSESFVMKRKKLASSEENHNEKEENMQKEELQTSETKIVNAYCNLDLYSPAEKGALPNVMSFNLNIQQKGDETVRHNGSKDKTIQSTNEEIQVINEATVFNPVIAKSVIEDKLNKKVVEQTPAFVKRPLQEHNENFKRKMLKQKEEVQQAKFPPASTVKVTFCEVFFKLPDEFPDVQIQPINVRNSLNNLNPFRSSVKANVSFCQKANVLSFEKDHSASNDTSCKRIKLESPPVIFAAEKSSYSPSNTSERKAPFLVENNFPAALKQKCYLPTQHPMKRENRFCPYGLNSRDGKDNKLNSSDPILEKVEDIFRRKNHINEYTRVKTDKQSFRDAFQAAILKKRRRKVLPQATSS